jgi:hypothetical protein
LAAARNAVTARELGDRFDHSDTENDAPGTGTRDREKGSTNENGTSSPARSDPALTFPGLAKVGGVDFQLDSGALFPSGVAISSDEGTISFCVQPQWNGSDGVVAPLLSATGDTAGFEIAARGDSLQFNLADSDGVETAATTSISEWTSGQRHLVTAAWGGGKTSLYVDGQLFDQQSYDGQVQMSPETPLQVGSRSPRAVGSLNDLQVYRRALQDSEIAALTTACQ